MFAAIDTASRPSRKTGLSIANTDIQISKDGGAYANATNGATELGTTGRYKVDVTAAEMDASWVSVKVVKTGMDDVDYNIATSGNPSGSVVSNGSNAAGTFCTDLTQSTNDHWKDSLLLFTSGSLAGQVKKVSAYDGTTKFVTLSTAFTGAPSAGDRFILVNL
jgi:hypothetical protein